MTRRKSEVRSPNPAKIKKKRFCTREVLELLRKYESRNITFIEPEGSWPIVWERAKGVHVWDADGKKYVDLTAAFGVAAAGHANARVIRAGQRQLGTLPHAMGDVHPHALKARLARELSRLTFERWTARARTHAEAWVRRAPTKGKTIFCNSGFEAVEAALKTAMLATAKPGVVAFTEAYHGLGYGALNATHRDHFRSPFRRQLAEFAQFVPFPNSVAESHPAEQRRRLAKVESHLRRLMAEQKTGAILVEPIQVRGGVNVPLPQFLPLLRQICNEQGALLIFDEIYTGFGRTGAWFACEHFAVVPDVICLGKALTGGFPLSACVGRADVMDRAWPPSAGEAIHTSTFLGHPVGCAMALAQIREIQRGQLVARSAGLGGWLFNRLKALRPRPNGLRLEARGLGLLAGIELRRADGSPAGAETFDLLKKMLRRGFILLPEGEHANVISLTPPLTITRHQLARAVVALQRGLSS